VAFLAAVAALTLVPLCLLGAPLSRAMLALGSAWPAAVHGVPISLGLAAACGAIVRRLPASPAARTLPAAGAFGLINALSPGPQQPAYLYQVGDRCAFRRQTFEALIGADDSLSAFDPRSEARWMYGRVASNDVAFDGWGWCSRVPVDAAARDLLLTRYFYTTAEATHGYKAPARPAKLVIVARDAPHVDALLDEFLRGQPPATTASVHFERTFPISTSSVVLRGYDVARPPGG
jgi:hypothetical protein